MSFGATPATECRGCRNARALSERTLRTAAVVTAEVPTSLAEAQRAQPVATYTLVGVNVLVYLAMGLSGVSWTSPAITDAIRWGADFGPLTLSGQWWRLFTSTFVHFGIVHIAFNMWCLWELGRALEFLMGRKAFVLTYVVSGLAASMVSIAWDPWRVSAGASGAIFGVAGAFVSYLYFRKTPVDPAVVRHKLKSLAIFIAYNLFYGLRSGIDNSAHLGGLAGGLLLGAILPPMIRATNSPAETPPIDGSGLEQSKRNKTAMTVALCSAAVLSVGALRLQAVNAPAALYGKAVRLARAGDRDAAIAEMQRSVKLNPKLLYGQALLGELELDQDHPSSAVGPLEQAVGLSENDVDITNNLSLAYLGAGRFQDSLGEMERAFAENKQDYGTGCFVVGVALDRLGQFQDAAKWLETALRSDSKFYAAQNALAQVEIEQGNVDRARVLYAGALKSDPGDQVAQRNLALLKKRGTAITASNLTQVGIPYSNLIAKGTAWPYYP